MKRRMSDIAVMMLSFLVLLALSAGAALVGVEAVRGEQWQLIRLTAWLQGSGVWGGIACIAVAVLALVLALMCLWRVFPHRTASQRGYVMQKNENGSIGVSIRAIEGLIRTCIDKHEAIAKADITVEECRDGIAIGLHIIQAAGVNIPLSVGAARQRRMGRHSVYRRGSAGIGAGTYVPVARVPAPHGEPARLCDAEE